MLFNTDPAGTEKLLAYAQNASNKDTKTSGAVDDWRRLPVDERLQHALVKGIDQYVVDDAATCLVVCLRRGLLG